MHFQWITGRFLLLGFVPDWIAMSWKVQQSLPWEMGSERCYILYSVEVAYLVGSDNVTAVCWVLWSQKPLGWYSAFKIQIKSFRVLNILFFFFFPKFENFTFQFNCTPSWEIEGQLCSDQGYSWELFPVPENLEMQLLKTEFPRLKRGINQSIFLVWKTRKNLMFSSFGVLRASGTKSLCLSKSQAKNRKLV